MIINNNTSPFNPVSPAPAKPGKTNPQSRAADSSDEAQLSSVSENDLTAVDPEIPDSGAASAITENMRQAMLSQPTLAMLAQGNSVAQSALRLLQQQ